MDDLSKKILINVDVANQEAQTKIGALEGAINDLATATTSLKTVTKNTQDAFTGYNEKLNQSKLTAQQNREEITRLNLVRKQEAEAVRNAKTQIEAANGSYKQAQQSLTSLGKAIREAKDGFTSTSPVIKAQIKDYNELNAKLKAFDAQMGNHQRNVGGYTEALSGINGILARLVPGFREFSEVLKVSSSGFNAMKGSVSQTGVALAETGEAAGEAEIATGGVAGAALGLTAAFAAVVAIGAGVIAYFKDVATFSDTLSDSWAGLKGGWTALIQSIGNMDPPEVWAQKFGKAYEKAKQLNQAIIDLNRDMLVSDVATNKENQFIATQMLKMRNLYTTSKEAEKIFQDVQKTANNQFKRVSEDAEQGYNIIANKIKLTAQLTRDELRELARDGVAAAEKFKEEGKHISDDLIADFAKFEMARATAQGIKDQVTQRAQNREEQRIAKNEAAHQKELSKEQQEAQELAKIKQETENVNSERIASITKMLNFQRESFGKELSESDEHYRQLIFKQREFIAKMQVIVNSKKSTSKEKNAARGAIGAANTDISQLGSEHTAAQQKFLEDHYKAILATTQKAANELAALQIQSINDEQEREMQSENLSYKEKNQALDKELEDRGQSERKLLVEIVSATEERRAILVKELIDEQNLIDIANNKKLETEVQHQQKQLDIIKKFEDQKQLLLDYVSVSLAQSKDENHPTEKNDKSLRDAEQKQLLDQYNAEVSVKGLTNEKMLKLERDYLENKAKINKIYLDKQLGKALQFESIIQQSALTIIKQGLDRQNEANQINMDRQRGHDLSNQSLTETQKYQVNEKYRVLEGKAKVKAFKENQELAIAEAIINGALAAIKTDAETGAIIGFALTPVIAAKTAAAIVTIAAEKPPAYAQGGLHYTSDGTGGVLPGYSKTDNTNAYLRSGEAVVVSEAMRDPWARNIVSAINQSYGGRSFDGTVSVNPWMTQAFAKGGVFSSYLPTGDNGLRPNMGNGRLHPDDINGIAQAVANINFPAPIVDIKDINYQQSRLANVTDRTSF